MLPVPTDLGHDAPMPTSRLRILGSIVFALLLALVAGLLFLWPGIQLARAICCESLARSAPPRIALDWHRALAPAFAAWAEERVASGTARSLSIHDISGTEWPLFGTVFFLRATHNLEQSWNEIGSGDPPSLHARRAIDAAVDLLLDPAQAHWVTQHWGVEHYLTRENVFYRMLLIDGLASHAMLTGSRVHHAVLREQASALARELDASATGLLADYPGQTFPADVAAAWHAIRRADVVLGTDHASAASRGLRGFTGAMAPELGLPPYAWFGMQRPEATEVRGSANAWLLVHAPFVWPDAARGWIESNDRHFWDETFWVSGFREFAKASHEPSYTDVDSGPVIAGFGTSASAFGLGAQRTAGQMDRAYPLALQMIAASWPLPGGRLLVPRLLSDLSDAPLLGEIAIVYNLSAPTAPGFDEVGAISRRRDVPAAVWATLIVQLTLGMGGLWRAGLRMRREFRR